MGSLNRPIQKASDRGDLRTAWTGSMWLRIALLGALVALATSGCGLAGGAVTSEALPPTTQQPTTTTGPPATDESFPTYLKSPVPTLEPRPEASCIDAPIQVDAEAFPLPDLARRSRVIAGATFEGYDKPVWDTPDGHRPSPDEFQHGNAIIIREINVADGDMLRGAKADLMDANQGGGQIGCDSVTFSNSREMVVGTRYVLFFFDAADPTGRNDIPSVLDALPLDTSNVAVASVEGPVPLGQIVKVIRNNPYRP